MNDVLRARQAADAWVRLRQPAGAPGAGRDVLWAYPADMMQRPDGTVEYALHVDVRTWRLRLARVDCPSDTSLRWFRGLVGRPFELFISYGHHDAAWVRTLADNLERAEVRRFFDEREIGPGDVLVHRLEEGLRSSRNGIVVVSPASVQRPWVQQEYTTMVYLV